MAENNDLQTRKGAATHFLQLVAAGRIEEAYQKYVDMQGKHHNQFFPAGFPALQKAMIESHIQFPKKQFTIKNVLGDGDFVAVHSHLVLSPGEKSMTVVHMFRFRNGKITEMWDLGQAVPPDSPNIDGPF